MERETMRKGLIAIVAGLVGLAASPALAADATGLWLTATKGGQVEITQCGKSLCGRLVSSEGLKADPNLKDVKNQDAKLRDRPLKGLVFLTGFTGGPKEWTGGKIYNAEDGKTYSGSITLASDDTLKLSGCVMSVLCQSQTWTRLR